MLETGSELIERAVRGDADALRELLIKHGPRTRSIIGSTMGAKWRAQLDEDDVMQVAYLEAFVHIGEFLGRDEAAFGRWLTRIAENALRDAVRALQRDKRPDPDRRVERPAATDSLTTLLNTLQHSTKTPSSHAAREEARQALAAVLERLPEDYATVVDLCDLKGMTVRDAAAKMGRSVGAVHMLRARAYAQLRSLMGNASQYLSRDA